MAENRPIPARAAPDVPHTFASSLAQSFRSSSPLAQELVARDLAECSDAGDPDSGDEHALDSSDSEDGIEAPTLYRRPSGIAYGTARPALGSKALSEPVLTREERVKSRDAERSLLRDNHILPPKHPGVARPSLLGRLYRRLFSTKVPFPSPDEESPSRAGDRTEVSPLLGPDLTGAPSGHEHLNEQWEAAVAEGRIKTTWQREAKTIAVYSRSLIVTFLLQYSINVASIFAVGRIGKLELGAVSRKYPSACQPRPGSCPECLD